MLIKSLVVYRRMLLLIAFNIKQICITCLYCYPYKKFKTKAAVSCNSCKLWLQNIASVQTVLHARQLSNLIKLITLIENKQIIML